MTTLQQVMINGKEYLATIKTYSYDVVATITINNKTFKWNYLKESFEDCLRNIQLETIKENQKLVEEFQKLNYGLSTFIVADYFITLQQHENDTYSMFLQPVYEIAPESAMVENVSFNRILELLVDLAEGYARLHRLVFFEFVDNGQLVRNQVYLKDVKKYVYGL